VTLLKNVARCSVVFVILFAAGFSSANVWLDEQFNDEVAFDDVDTYSYNALANPLNVVDTGAIASDRAFDGTRSYVLSAGQSVYVTEPYQDQANGPFQYFQFAASVGSIPASGTMATFRWDFTLNDIRHSFFIHFVGTGSAVNLIGGEDLAGGTVSRSFLIDTIPDTSTWKFLTVQIQKNGTAEDDSRLGQTAVPQGAYFYSSSTSPAGNVPLYNAGTMNDKGHAWVIDVTSESLYLDNMYWEGGMTGALDDDNLRALDTGVPTNVEDWKLY